MGLDMSLTEDLSGSNKNGTAEMDEDSIKRIVVDNDFNELKSQMDELRQLVSNDSTFTDLIDQLELSILNLNVKINLMNNDLINKDCEIEFLNDKLNKNDLQLDNLNDLISKKDMSSKISELESEFKALKYELMKIVDIQINLADKQTRLNEENYKLKQFNQLYSKQLMKLDAYKYCVHFYDEEIKCNRLEVEYSKNNPTVKKILSPFAYVYMMLKSGRELSLNFKLYRALKNSDCFNVGHYLHYNKDLQESFWSKYFSLELHYVCKGFKEGRKFDKRSSKRNSKKDILESILAFDK